MERVGGWFGVSATHAGCHGVDHICGLTLVGSSPDESLAYEYDKGSDGALPRSDRWVAGGGGGYCDTMQRKPGAERQF